MTDLTTLPLTSSHWGTYRVETQDDRVKALHRFEHDNDMSPIGPSIIDVLDGPTRILTPAIRKSWFESGASTATERRGTEPFISVSWETAEQLVANELDRVRNKYGNSAIYAGSYGWASAGRFHHAQSHIHRFLNCIGGYTSSKDTYSFAAGEIILPHVLGNLYTFLTYATSWRSITDSSELLVAFGGIPLKNGQINAGGVGRHTQKENLQRAVKSGLRIVNISPIQADVPEFANAEWLAPRPNTDTAILIGIAHTLYTKKLYDKKFIEKYTCGFEQFLNYLNGKTDGTVKNTKWAAQISGLTEADILSLTENMASRRTMLSLSWSLTRQDHGEQPFWAGLAVAAMLGQIGLPGGGIGFGYCATNSIGNHGTKIPAISLPQGINPIRDFIPVARISDMLLRPGETFTYNGQTETYPDIHLIYWAGGNPFHHHQDLNRMLKAWQKPDTVIVNEWCWNSLAKHADIVLPCTTTLERNDIAFSPRDPYVIYMQKVVNPPAEARNDFEIFSGIARKMAVESEYTENRDETAWLEWLYQNTLLNAGKRNIEMPDFENFKATGWFAPPPPELPTVLLKAFRDDPVSNPLKTPSGKIELFSAVIKQFEYHDCPGHPTWIEPLEWLGNADKFPLHLLSNQPTTKLHSQLDHGSYSRSRKINDREPVTINPSEADKRGLLSGDIVRIFNDRGTCLAGLIIDPGIMDGVALISTGAWFDPLEPGTPESLCKHGNPNVLTLDKGTSSLAQGPSANTCLVQIEKYRGLLPPVTAFDPPEIIPDA